MLHNEQSAFAARCSGFRYSSVTFVLTESKMSLLNSWYKPQPKSAPHSKLSSIDDIAEQLSPLETGLRHDKSGKPRYEPPASWSSRLCRQPHNRLNQTSRESFPTCVFILNPSSRQGTSCLTIEENAVLVLRDRGLFGGLVDWVVLGRISFVWSLAYCILAVLLAY